jgi:hypothetical protein
MRLSLRMMDEPIDYDYALEEAEAMFSEDDEPNFLESDPKNLFVPDLSIVCPTCYFRKIIHLTYCSYRIAQYHSQTVKRCKLESHRADSLFLS